MDTTPSTEPHSLRRRGGRTMGIAAGVAAISVLAGTAGAGAATLVTSAQIKDSTIVSIDVKNGSLTGKDVKDSSVTGKDVKNGTIASTDIKDGTVVSADIKDGTIATADISAAARADAMTGLIPSGTTVTGSEFFDTQSSVSGDFGFTVTLPGRASALLTSNDVHFRTDPTGIYTDEENTCAGSASVPTAPAGEVCVYLVSRTADSGDIRAEEVYNHVTDTAFAVRWIDSHTSDDVYMTVVWAYTAP